MSSVKLMAEIMKTANTNNGYSNPLYAKYIKTEIGNTIPPPLIVIFHEKSDDLVCQLFQIAWRFLDKSTLLSLRQLN